CHPRLSVRPPVSIRILKFLAFGLLACFVFAAPCSSQSFLAIADFEADSSDEYVPSYTDNNRTALAINAAKYQDAFSSATCKYRGGDWNFRPCARDACGNGRRIDLPCQHQ
ncbi:MAG: hypothetical protein AAF802_31735, partial [Planctomycetota bacterium]